jgi:site-specific DNA-cytosine methylase
MTNEIVFRALFPFCGLGAGARGFLDAHSHLFDFSYRFECMGGIDFDAEACADFEYLTDSPAWCEDMERVTGPSLRARYGTLAPDCVFLSPPCKGASGLLPKELAGTEKYQKMNELALVWMRAMIDAWREDPPKLVLLENVPRLRTRAKGMLDQCKKMLRAAGYRLHEGFHDCGEIGGLAQHRRRYLLVARLEKRVMNLLHEAPKKRVRACGEVLEQLPVPATVEARAFGKLHELPRISWLNWVRLALIPPGGDWRDLEGVLAEGQPRRSLFKRHEVAAWTEPTGVITGAGANAIGHVQDPRVEPFGNVDRITPWTEPVGTITRSPAPSSGAAAAADPRVSWFNGTLGVRKWDEPAGVVTADAAPSRGAFSVADPGWRPNTLGVMEWSDAAPTITGNTRPSNGRFSVADPMKRQSELELGCEPRAGSYGVRPWDRPSPTVVGKTSVDSGANVADPRVDEIALPPSEGRHWNKYAVGSWEDPARAVIGAIQPGSGGPGVADPRPMRKRKREREDAGDPRVSYAYDAGYAVLDWSQAARTIAGTAHVGCGAYAVAEPRPDRPPFNVELEAAIELAGKTPKKPPPFLPIIVSKDGTWHRPLTTLELASLQGIPTTWKGAPLVLAGKSQSAWRERIGNAVPVGAARAIAEMMLITLGASALGRYAMQSGAVWVLPDGVASQGFTLSEVNA